MSKRAAVEVKVGDTFGHWTVLREKGADHFGRKRFEVRGACGDLRTMERYSIVSSKRRVCSACLIRKAA
jgi:hypothetical protein